MAKNRASLKLESIIIKINKKKKDKSYVKSRVNSGPHHCLSCNTLVFYHIVHIIYNVAPSLAIFDFNHIAHTICNIDI